MIKIGQYECLVVSRILANAHMHVPAVTSIVVFHDKERLGQCMLQN